MTQTRPNVPPPNPTDDNQIIDGNGNVWEYNFDLNIWNYIGVVESPSVVTSTNDGVITPAIYAKLTLIEKLKSKGYDFNNFKLTTEYENPYFYLFYSPDDTIKFIPEARTQLRIEVNRQKAMRRLTSICCVGPKGAKGEIGLSGKDGISAANEIFKYPTNVIDGFQFNTAVLTPINTELSMRIYNENTKLQFEMWYNINNHLLTFYIDNEEIEIEESSTYVEYDKITTIFKGNIHFTPYYDMTRWKYKVRQRGAKGDPGEDGSNFVEIATNTLSDSSLQCTEIISSLRKPPSNNQIYFLKSELPEYACTSNLTISASILPTGENKTLVALETTTRSCKNFGFYQYQFPEVEIPEVQLPAWSPTSECSDYYRFNMYLFDWWKLANPPYLWEIEEPQRPPEQCCQEDFFYCPGEGPCPVEGDLGGDTFGSNAIPNKMPVPAGSTTSEVCFCTGDYVIDGTIKYFEFKETAIGKCAFGIDVEWDPIICIEEQGKPGYKENCPVIVIVTCTGQKPQIAMIEANIVFDIDTGPYDEEINDCPPEDITMGVTINAIVFNDVSTTIDGKETTFELKNLMSNKTYMGQNLGEISGAAYNINIKADGYEDFSKQSIVKKGYDLIVNIKFDADNKVASIIGEPTYQVIEPVNGVVRSPMITGSITNPPPSSMEFEANNTSADCCRGFKIINAKECECPIPDPGEEGGGEKNEICECDFALNQQGGIVITPIAGSSDDLAIPGPPQRNYT